MREALWISSKFQKLHFPFLNVVLKTNLAIELGTKSCIENYTVEPTGKGWLGKELWMVWMILKAQHAAWKCFNCPVWHYGQPMHAEALKTAPQRVSGYQVRASGRPAINSRKYHFLESFSSLEVGLYTEEPNYYCCCNRIVVIRHNK